ncbi:MAG: hypothetical protein H7X76_01305 [Prolixibacteraceae bacterium]|nr:hypothetical protein [Burkholderiales bacterium]
MIAAAIAALGFASTVSAQKDAAEKAKEGDIEHWIEYYKGEQRKPVAASPKDSVPAPGDRVAPVEEAEPNVSVRRKNELK